MIKKLLIANRGEIACRIIKTARQLGIHTVAVYASVDAQSEHVRLSDEAILLGFAPASDSYLNADKIISAAKKTGADAIHPGYGFLSENADFAKRCLAEKIIFVGPSVDAITSMADKAQAKRCMQAAHIPTIPGYLGEQQDAPTLIAAAEEMGLPVMLKAAAGGGGKGMRLVTNVSQLPDAIDSAKREAMKSFGDDVLMIEKYISPARHIEVQIFADQHGNVVHLFERDCSIQRRHQKVIEESLAPHFSDATRHAITQAAVDAAQAIHYVGAGTVEFLVDTQENFYFMEMNTRLQVEHPITEMITQTDLVAWQLKVASGEPLPLKQSDLHAHGHAIEARIYAENPLHDFAPSIGTLTHLIWPEPSPHIRIDSGVTQGDRITPYYDPMIAKLIVWDTTRDKAIMQLTHALGNTYITGVKSNVYFLKCLIQSDAFKAGQLNTAFIEKNPCGASAASAPCDAVLLAAASAYLRALPQPDHSPWSRRDNWRLNENAKIPLTLWADQIAYRLEVDPATLQENTLATDDNHLKVLVDSDQVHVFSHDAHWTFSLTDPKLQSAQHGTAENHLIAPMPGMVVEVAVEAGQTVEAGSKLMVLEAMKMEHTLYAPIDGTIVAVHFKAGDMLNEGDELLEITERTI